MADNPPEAQAKDTVALKLKAWGGKHELNLILSMQGLKD
jgi:hypothetical protein